MGVDVTLNAYERDLKAAYEEVLATTEHPDWAYPYTPPIPFVGSGYGEDGRSKVLVYASAENLTYTKKQKVVPLWLQPKNQILRSRIVHHVHGGTCIHIQPVDNGSLLKAARHSLNQVEVAGAFAVDSPKSFLGQVAVANAGKFSVNAQRNVDYAGDGTPWVASMPFIRIDLHVLNPDIIIIPRSILNTLRTEPLDLDMSGEGRTIIPNYQITAGTINRHIKRQLRKTSVQRRISAVEDWQLTSGWQKLDMGSYLHWLDAVAIHWIEPRKKH